jgi:hypothetical protein
LSEVKEKKDAQKNLYWDWISYTYDLMHERSSLNSRLLNYFEFLEF